MKFIFNIIMLVCSNQAYAQEIAFSFDDAPMEDSALFQSNERSKKLISILKKNKVPGAMIFSNPCKSKDNATDYLKKYLEAGHFIANHTCSHLRLDEVGPDAFIADTQKADIILLELMQSKKFFRFPYLNEGSNEKDRDKIRDWLRKNNYRNGMVSVDDDDYAFSWALNKAKKQNKKIALKKIKKLYVEHLIGAVEFYDQLAKNQIGYSPKHVILLHENDSSVLFLDSLLVELKKRNWKFISTSEAYQDKIYFEAPKNTYANNGIIAQLVFEKTNQKYAYNKYDSLHDKLIKELRLQVKNK